ncbi:MAG: helix-turn-helix domain-containing protein [Acidobacteria bacterium]|nr:helix-turn-helix domain-containing protein [Acidobacteriota bacterium]
MSDATHQTAQGGENGASGMGLEALADSADRILTRGPRLLDAKTAARALGLPYTSLRDATFRGELAVVKVGRRWFFDRRDLERFIESHKERYSA